MDNQINLIIAISGAILFQSYKTVNHNFLPLCNMSNYYYVLLHVMH